MRCLTFQNCYLLPQIEISEHLSIPSAIYIEGIEIGIQPHMFKKSLKPTCRRNWNTDAHNRRHATDLERIGEDGVWYTLGEFREWYGEGASMKWYEAITRTCQHQTGEQHPRHFLKAVNITTEELHNLP